MRKQIIKTLALVLVFAFIITAAAPPKASAVIPEGLLIAAAITLTMGVCVAITMIAADSAGMTGAIQAAAEAGLQDTAEFTEKLIRGFNEERNMAFTQFLLMMVKGAAITRDGALALGEEVSAWLTDFFDWSWSEEGGNLQEFAPFSGGFQIDISQIPDFPYPELADLTFTNAVVYNYNQSYRFERSPSSYVTRYSYNRPQKTTTMIFINFAPFTNDVYATNTGALKYHRESTLESVTVNGLHFDYYEDSFGYGQFDSSVPIFSSTSRSLIDRIAYLLTFKDQYAEGEREQPDTSVLQLPADGAIDTNILNLPDQITLPPVQGTVTADSYLDAVRDAIYTGTGELEYTDANDVVGSATLEMAGSATVDQVASGAGELEGSTDIAEGIGSPTLDNYSIDLRDFFPFCIPFDLYDMLNLLSGSRAAPQVHWEFYVPMPDGMEKYNLELDFSVLDPVASVLRTMELLAFAFALAIGTKKLLMGS